MLAGALHLGERHERFVRRTRLHSLRDARLLDALDAIGALLHHPTHAHRDIRIFRHFQAVGHALLGQRPEVKLVERTLVVVEEIEAPDLPRAVVRAIPRANATVVGHEIEAVVAVHRGIDRADRFAGRIFAVLAHDGLRKHFRVVLVSGKVTVHADPGHVAAARDLIFAHDGHVVLRLAGDDARVATRASAQIDRHAPLLGRSQRRMGEKRNVRRDVPVHPHGLRKSGLLGVTLGRRLPHQIAAFHALVRLRLGKFVFRPGALERDVRNVGHPARGAQGISIETCFVRHRRDLHPPVTERDAHRAVRLTRGNQGGSLDRPVAGRKLHHVPGGHAEFLRGVRTDQRGIVPRDLRGEIRRLLQPPVVGVTPVIQRAARNELDVQAAARWLVLRGECRGGSGVESQRGLGPRGVGEETLTQKLGPLRLEVAATRRPGKGFTHQLRADRLFVAGQTIQNFHFRHPVPQREDHRLHRADRAIRTTGIAPAFEVMRLRHMPLAGGRGFVFVKSETHADRDAGKKIAEAQIGRRIVNRVAAQDEKVLHPAGLHRGGQFPDRGGRRGFGPQTAQSPARRSQGGIDGQTERLHRGGLLVAHHDDTFAGRGGQILGTLRDPLRIGGKRAVGKSSHDRSQTSIPGQCGDLFSQRTEESAGLGGLDPQSVVGQAARRGVMRLRDVKPVHRLARLADPAAGHEPAHLVEPAEGGVEEIAVHREHFVRAAEVGYDTEIAAEAGRRGRRGLACAERLVFGPKKIGEFFPQLPEQPVTGWRVNALDEESEAVPAMSRRRDFIQLGPQRGGIRLDPADLDRFRTVRIVKIKHRGLGKGVGRAIADRVQRIALQLGRTPVARRGDERHGAVAARHGRGVVKEFSRNGPFRPLREGHEIRFGAPATGQTDTGQRHRSAH